MVIIYFSHLRENIFEDNKFFQSIFDKRLFIFVIKYIDQIIDTLNIQLIYHSRILVYNRKKLL